MDKDRKCEECAFYRAHYIKAGSNFMKTCCGHCVNRNMSLRESQKRIQKRSDCEFWEPYEIQIQERHKSIEANVAFIAERLDIISQILNDDKQ